jgi:hypothetical protein
VSRPVIVEPVMTVSLVALGYHSAVITALLPRQKYTFMQNCSILMCSPQL